MDWLLLVPYLCIQILILLLFLLTGYLILGILFPVYKNSDTLPNTPTPPNPKSLFTFCLTYAVGLAAWSFALSLLGLSRQFNRPAVASLVTIVLILGLIKISRTTSIPSRTPLVKSPLLSHISWIQWIIASYSILFAAWLIIGAAAPDFSQDSMWYHLTIPRAWVHRGFIAAFPLNMPSNYALGFETLFAGILLFSNEISCSLLSTQVAIIVMLTIIAASARLYGKRAGWIAATLAPTLFAASVFRIPSPASNDVAAMLTMLLALLLLADPDKTSPGYPGSWRTALLAGALAGIAFTFKIITAGFLLPFVLWMMLSTISRRTKRNHNPNSSGPIPYFIAFAAAVALTYSPWALRNIFYGCGNPLFPFGRNLLPYRPEYANVMQQSENLNQIFSLTPSGIADAFRTLPHRMQFFSSSADMVAPVLVLFMLLGLLLTKGTTRRIAIALLLQCLALVMINGSNEIVRYFSLCYPSAIILAAGLIILVWNQRPEIRRILAMSIAIATVGSAFSFWTRQIRWISYPSIAWPGHPVLTQKSREAYGRNKEAGGPLMEPLRAITEILPRNAKVLMPDCPYPFYLNRYYLWSCEVSPPILTYSWKGLDATGAAKWLRDNAITHILFINPPNDKRIQQLISLGALKKVPYRTRAKEIGSIQLYECAKM